MKKTTRSQKQITVLSYILMTNPSVTVGEAARLLNAWEYKCGNVFNVKG